ncbi:MAG: hypothetical protein HFF90_09390 [Oscillibacter sp.]|nr:hypothetical protein [Oscillibacter sp.]
MAIASRTIVVTLGLGLAALIGAAVLQVYLSRRESRWPGLVLPLLTFLLAVLMVLNVADTGSVSENVLTVVVVLLVGNVPTMVLLSIYWAVREKRRVRDQVEKMRIEDL